MHVKVTETQRGPSVLLSYVFIYQEGEEEEEVQHGEDVVVNNLVQISTKGMSSDKFVLYMTHRKLSKDEKDVEVLLRVTCENPSFDRQWISTENESSWLKIGDVDNCTIIEKGTSYMHYVQININVRKIEKPGLRTQMFLDTDFVDFSLSAVDGSVAVHKIVMASHSDVFKAMLNGEWKENIEGRVEVSGTTQQCLGHLKDYMYLDILPDEGLCPLLLLASYYMIGNLKTRCIGKLTDSVRSDNLYELLDFACANNIPELTYELLHSTPSEVVDRAYKSRKETKPQKPKGNEHI